MKKAIFTLFTLLCLPAQTTFADASDPRELVKMPNMMRQHMMGNMRDHLLSIAEIQAFLGAGAFDKAADVAETRLGATSLKSHNAAHMAPYMPPRMQAIGSQMHKAASQFAVIAQESAVTGDNLRAISALSKITEQCVACHAAYRTH